MNQIIQNFSLFHLFIQYEIQNYNIDYWCSLK